MMYRSRGYGKMRVPPLDQGTPAHLSESMISLLFDPLTGLLRTSDEGAAWGGKTAGL